MGTMKERWDKKLTELEATIDSPEAAIDAFFNILDYTETSGPDDRVFHPTTISSCRVWESAKLGAVLKKLREYRIENKG